MEIDRNALTKEMVDDILEINFQTGELIWKWRPEKYFVRKTAANSWNIKFAGKPAMTAFSTHGYRFGQVFNKPYFAHTIIWISYSGGFPNGEIDHIDGNILNNSIENLRDVSHQTNLRNCHHRRKTKSGEPNIIENKNSFTVCFVINGKRERFGIFRSLEEAKEHRDKIKTEIGFSQRHSEK